MTKTIAVGVLGVGVMGAEHARLLADEISSAEVSQVYDLDAGRAEAVAKSAGALAVDDPFALIQDSAVDAVLVASSDATHEQFVLAALAAGKPVLCEKPLAPTTDACRRIVDAERDSGRRLVSVGFMRRFDPGYRAVRAELRAGAIGDPLVLHCIHRNAVHPATDSTTLITGSMVHEIDIARWLLDDEFASVTVHTPRRSRYSGELQDPMIAVFTTSSGVHVDVEVFGNAHYGYDVRCELVGETGTVELDRPAELVRRSDNAVSRDVAIDWRDRFGDAYRRELQDWIDAIRDDRPPAAATAADGYLATVVAEATVQAFRTGVTQRVDLPAVVE